MTQHEELPEQSRHSVLVERHLNTELKLVESLEAMNEDLATMLTESGIRGLTRQQFDSFSAVAESLGVQAAHVKRKRTTILEQINRNRDVAEERITIRQFIQRADPANQKRLEQIRLSIIDKLVNIQAILQGNQAVFYYSFDFYKKMASGLLQCDLEESKYRPDGQSGGVKPGNFYRKAC